MSHFQNYVFFKDEIYERTKSICNKSYTNLHFSIPKFNAPEPSVSTCREDTVSKVDGSDELASNCHVISENSMQEITGDYQNDLKNELSKFQEELRLKVLKRKITPSILV
jgi:hypothetical protein